MLLPMKKMIIELICEKLGNQLERLRHAAMESQLAATDRDSKAESKYDTRNLEASYLAAGQARQVEELSEAVQLFERYQPADFSATGSVGPGALVEIKCKGESMWFFLVPAAGGLEVNDGERVVTLLSPDSHLYQQLIEATLGQTLERPCGRISSIL